MDSYYPDTPAEWPLTRARLRPLLGECLESEEYFALLGASQLNTGSLTLALESLERALLINPEYAAAQVDYAEALFRSGQLFPALELNRRLLARRDVPPTLAGVLTERQEQWLARTTSKGLRADVSTGYDSNLNGGPSSSDITLTLSGESITLTLDEDFRPVSGPFLNLSLAGFYRKETAEYTHDFLASVRARNSEHGESDLLQLDWRYSLGGFMRSHFWDFTAGTSHLLYGGSPLYSVTESRLHLRHEGEGCQPQYDIAAQYQLFHGQSIFNGIESSASAGLECRMPESGRTFGLEAGVLDNYAVKDGRPGSSRDGWLLRLYWQESIGGGTLDAQASFSSLRDETGYNPVLANDARREILSRFIKLQYSRNLRNNLVFFTSLTNRGQNSNLQPFHHDGTAIEFGLSGSF